MCCFKTRTLPDGGISLSLEGEALFEHENELYHTMHEALKHAEFLEVHCGSVIRADYSFVMLICAVHRTAALLGKRLIIAEGLSAGVLLHFEHARQSRADGCIYARGEPCLFWQALKCSDQGMEGAGDTRMLLGRLDAAPMDPPATAL